MLRLSLTSPLTENMAAKAQALPGKGMPWQSGRLGTGAGTFRESPHLFPFVPQCMQEGSAASSHHDLPITRHTLHDRHYSDDINPQVTDLDTSLMTMGTITTVSGLVLKS